MSDQAKNLASSMVLRSQSGADPYVLLLGAGASASSGCSTMMQIADDVLRSREPARFSEWMKEIEKASLIDLHFGELQERELGPQKLKLFFEIWGRLDRETQYSILRKHLWDGKNPSDGYIDLANLIKDGYIKVVLSTNQDNLLEKALNDLGWYQPENFVVIINGKDKPEEIREQIESSRVPFKLIKLHGSLESPGSFAFTPEEVFDFEASIKPSLSRVLNQSLIIIGHSMQDRDIDNLFDEEGKEIYFVNRNLPETNSRIDIILRVRGQGGVISGEDGTFDAFLRKLRQFVEKDAEEKATSCSKPSIEGFLQSIGYGHELKVPRSRFRSLPDLYVKPTEYDDICLKLEKENVLFIIGEPHLGKTYTAFYLLWEYYQKGYETLHIRHDKLISLLHQNEGNMKNLLLNLFSGDEAVPRIIHFDDPFGETMERRSDVFAKELDTFLDLMHDYEQIKVIVTTRLNIFRESLAMLHDPKKIEILEKDLRVHTSYRRDILLEILHRYTYFYKPLWASDKNIVLILDDKLPDLLPAPHNIEFFVRTSERLTSIDEVLRHVETSKEMVKALGEWMASLPDHEQLFLAWLEICSAIEIIFLDTKSSEINIENAYNKTLATMFLKKHLSGIPSDPFSRAIDKFNMIILESREGDSGLIKLNFVHPSYHEAFWYAVKLGLSLARWWNLLKKNIKMINNSIDLVQLGMIERYGTVNRDLDQLLLLSAESKNINEQIIALKHMSERIFQFKDLPQFAHCIKSILKSNSNEYYLLDIISENFAQLQANIIIDLIQLVFDSNRVIRGKSNKILTENYDKLNAEVKNAEIIRTWVAIRKLYAPPMEIIKKQKQLLKPRSLNFRENEEIQAPIVDHVNPNETSFSSDDLIISFNEDIDSHFGLTLNQEVEDYFDIFYLLRALPNKAIEKKIFNRFINMDIERVKLIMNVNNEDHLYNIMHIIFKNYDKVPQTHRHVAFSSDSVILSEIISDILDKKFKNIPEKILIDCLSSPGLVQYTLLSRMFINYGTLSEGTKFFINNLINLPSDWWIGGSLGALTIKVNRVKKDVLDLVSASVKINRNNKEFMGAFLAEMAQGDYDGNLGLRKKFKSLFIEISRDQDIAHYAEEWIDQEMNVFKLSNEEYWHKVKNHLRYVSRSGL
jgi:hypothetical protein